MRSVTSPTGALVVSLASLVVGTACDKPRECASWTTEVLSQPPQERTAAFGRFPIDSQFTLVLCQNRTIHPSPLDLSVAFAERGSAAVPFLSRRLAEAEDDLTIRDIVLILSLMQHRAYDVAANQGLVALMRRRAGEMKDAELRASTVSMIERLSP
jgi:hypothetical protein